MKIKINVAELCHDAADNHLALTDKEYWIRGGNKEKYSCCAIDMAFDKLVCGKGITSHEGFQKREALIDTIHEGLNNMGCDTGSIGLFKDPAEGLGYCLEQSQQDRYFWLKWVALMAEEQGVVYEIS